MARVTNERGKQDKDRHNVWAALGPALIVFVRLGVHIHRVGERLRNKHRALGALRRGPPLGIEKCVSYVNLIAYMHLPPLVIRSTSLCSNMPCEQIITQNSLTTIELGLLLPRQKDRDIQTDDDILSGSVLHYKALYHCHSIHSDRLLTTVSTTQTQYNTNLIELINQIVWPKSEHTHTHFLLSQNIDCRNKTKT